MDIIPELPQKADDSVRQEQVQKKQNEYHLIGKTRRIPGHTLFEFNKVTKEIRPAEIDRKAIVSFDPKSNSEQVKYETKTKVSKDCFYLQALNIENAKKKLKKIGML